MLAPGSNARTRRQHPSGPPADNQLAMVAISVDDSVNVGAADGETL